MKAIEKLIGKRVIIRADRAGVFYGTLNEVEPNGDKLQVELTDLRRLWYWEWPTAPSYNNYEHPMFHKGEDIHNVPCWSTQALLDEIPYTLLNKDNEDLKLHIEKDGEQYYLFYENEYTGDMFEIETDMHDDLIDACVEMILKLKEKKML